MAPQASPAPGGQSFRRTLPAGAMLVSDRIPFGRPGETYRNEAVTGRL